MQLTNFYFLNIKSEAVFDKRYCAYICRVGEISRCVIPLNVSKYVILILDTSGLTDFCCQIFIDFFLIFVRFKQDLSHSGLPIGVNFTIFYSFLSIFTIFNYIRK